MGVDVRELIRSAHQEKQQMQNQEGEQDIRQVIFTFVGREGLIEDGNNQEVEMSLDLSQNCDAEAVKE